MRSYRRDGVRLDRELPDTVLSVEEALELAFGAIGDPINKAEVMALVERINAENTRREDAREAWETAETKLLGVKLIPGGFYNVYEMVGSFRRNAGHERAARFCEYVGRRGYQGDEERISYHFTRWGADAAKKVDLSLYGGPSGRRETWAARSIVRLEPVVPTEALRENVRLSRLGSEERGIEKKRLIEERDKLLVTPRAKA